MVEPHKPPAPPENIKQYQKEIVPEKKPETKTETKIEAKAEVKAESSKPKPQDDLKKFIGCGK